jgi:REP element-mobilizing transposase RayT
MQRYTDVFDPGYIYHVFNRAVGFDKLFYADKNYLYFLDLLKKGPEKHFNLITYCLLPNHFHLVLQIKDSTDPGSVSESFRRFGISFSQAINKQQRRKGSLFMKPIKRKRVTDEKYLKELILYTHLNPVHHGVDKDYKNYRWSSYQNIVKGTMNTVSNGIIEQYFGDIENFEFVHDQRRGFEGIQDLTFE